jgi:hypothetical protein
VRQAQANRVIVLRALSAIALIVNGMAVPPATAMQATAMAGEASHASHHPEEPMPAASHADHSAGVPGGDCCEGPGCDCGCAVPQAVNLSIALPRAAWRAASSEFTFVVKSFHSSPHAAPFRPPA